MANPAVEDSDSLAAAAAAASVTDDDLAKYVDPLVDGELEQEPNSDFVQNPDILASSKEIKKEEPEAENKDNKDEKQNNLKSTLLFSGAVVAVIGVIFAVLKKIKEA
ncbi:hypothetical protein ACH5RR_009705 [Cinchona calisaya]|uniref:Uncharacterized protein n=1 Tax=Cinchona calisaya TaxID=153742 RepID=A0ABD3AFR7_9GENT